MIVYHASKKGFIKDVFNGSIADDIDHAFLLHLGRHTSPNEKLSWKNSMMHMYKVINTPDIPDTSTIAIEYQ
ncbi:MAG: AAA family ATPase, partial [Phocaeicola sp.]|nr:AAA family ATPase [Phocaeicola sp.]